MEDRKRNIIIPIITLIIGSILGALFPSMFVPDIKSVYTSDVTIDQYGFNYTSAKWEYHIQPEKKYIWSFPKESWSYFIIELRDLRDDFNLSDYKGVSFCIKGNIENQKIEFNLFSDKYQYWNKGNLLVTTKWREDEILFSNLCVAPWTEKWHPEAPKNPNLEKVRAFGFAIKTTTPTENKIWIDEVELIHRNGSKTIISNFNTLNASINGKEGLWHVGWGYS